MDEVSSETLTSASPTNDKSDKSIADIGGQKNDKEPVSALSKNDKEVEIKGDVESKKRDESPEPNNLHTSNGKQEQSDEEEGHQEQHEQENSDQGYAKSSIESKSNTPTDNDGSNDLNQDVDKVPAEDSNTNNQMKEDVEEEEVEEKEETEIIQTSADNSLSLEPSDPLADKSDVRKGSNCSSSGGNATSKDGGDDTENKNASTEEKKIEISNDTNVISPSEDKQKTSNGDDTSSSSSPITCNEKEEVIKAEVSQKVKSEIKSSNVFLEETEKAPSLKSEIKPQDKNSFSNEDCAGENKEKYKCSEKTNKTSESVKPQQISCESECQNVSHDRGKQKPVSESSLSETSSAVATQRSAEPRSSATLPNNASKAPSAVATKPNTLEILTAKHLNDSSKFEIFKGLIEVGKMSNKEVVNAVLYLVREFLNDISQITCIFHCTYHL